MTAQEARRKTDEVVRIKKIKDAEAEAARFRLAILSAKRYRKKNLKYAIREIQDQVNLGLGYLIIGEAGHPSVEFLKEDLEQLGYMLEIGDKFQYYAKW